MPTFSTSANQAYAPFLQRRRRPIGMEGYQIGGVQRAKMTPTMEQEKRADADPHFAKTLYGNVQRSARSNLKRAEAYAAAAPPVPPVDTDVVTRGEAQVAQRRRQSAQTIHQARQGYVTDARDQVSNAGTMLARSQRARELGVAPSAVAATERQINERETAQRLAEQSVQADVALKRGQGFEATLGGLGRIGAVGAQFYDAFTRGREAKADRDARLAEAAANREAAMQQAQMQTYGQVAIAQAAKQQVPKLDITKDPQYKVIADLLKAEQMPRFNTTTGERLPQDQARIEELGKQLKDRETQLYTEYGQRVASGASAPIQMPTFTGGSPESAGAMRRTQAPVAVPPQPVQPPAGAVNQVELSDNTVGYEMPDGTIVDATGKVLGRLDPNGNVVPI